MHPVAALDALPGQPGAYGLALRLDRGLALSRPGRAAWRLAAGTYLYCGSAWGPGGLRARVLRHARAPGRLHWHIDRLRHQAELVAVCAIPRGRECWLAARALALPGVSVPAPGFGSSDCRRCAAHLVLLPAGTGMRDIVGGLERVWLWDA